MSQSTQPGTKEKDMVSADHDPHIAADALEEVRAQIEGMPSRAFEELRSLALQMVEDLAGAYARIGVAYQRLDRWNAGFAAAERYFADVNDVDEATVGANGDRREAVATGAAAYRDRLLRAFRSGAHGVSGVSQ